MACRRHYDRKRGRLGLLRLYLNTKNIFYLADALIEYKIVSISVVYTKIVFTLIMNKTPFNISLNIIIGI